MVSPQRLAIMEADAGIYRPRIMPMAVVTGNKTSVVRHNGAKTGPKLSIFLAVVDLSFQQRQLKMIWKKQCFS